MYCQDSMPIQTSQPIKELKLTQLANVDLQICIRKEAATCNIIF